MRKMERSKKEMPEKNCYILLEPESHTRSLRLAEVWQYRDLVLLLTKKTFVTSYQQTVLGPLWLLIRPVLSSLVYLFIFGHVAAIGTGGIPQILFYLVSSSLWELFAFSLNSNASTFITNAGIFGKVYFPRLAVPFSNMLVGILRFGIQLLIILGMMALFLAEGAIHPHWQYYPLLPLLILQLSFLGMSVGILFSSLTTRYRDLMHLVSMLVGLWMYASAVVYPLQAIPEGTLKTMIKINPVTSLMELTRLIMLGEGSFLPVCYLAETLGSILLFVGSTIIFHHVERTFMDTV